MINLIPPDGKRTVRKEYIARVASVWLFIAALAIASGALMLFPTYILVAQQLTIDASNAVSDEAYNQALKELNLAQALATKLAAPQRGVPAADILAHAEDALEDGVVLRGISIESVGGVPSVQAVGTAQTRELLRRFIANLESDPFFTDASVPVSDLARDVDLVFTLTLTLAQRTNP
jgi:hypothetical protein